MLLRVNSALEFEAPDLHKKYHLSDAVYAKIISYLNMFATSSSISNQKKNVYNALKATKSEGVHLTKIFDFDVEPQILIHENPKFDLTRLKDNKELLNGALKCCTCVYVLEKKDLSYETNLRGPVQQYLNFLSLLDCKIDLFSDNNPLDAKQRNILLYKT